MSLIIYFFIFFIVFLIGYYIYSNFIVKNKPKVESTDKIQNTWWGFDKRFTIIDIIIYLIVAIIIYFFLLGFTLFAPIF